MHYEFLKKGIVSVCSVFNLLYKWALTLQIWPPRHPVTSYQCFLYTFSYCTRIILYLICKDRLPNIVLITQYSWFHINCSIWLRKNWLTFLIFHPNYNQIYNWTNMSWNSTALYAAHACSFNYKSDYSGAGLRYGSQPWRHHIWLLLLTVTIREWGLKVRFKNS